MEIEEARRAYVAAIGTADEFAKRRELERVVESTRAPIAKKRTA